jgi:hypothetical protein
MDHNMEKSKLNKSVPATQSIKADNTRFFIGLGVAAMAFAVILFLMAHAVWLAGSTPEVTLGATAKKMPNNDPGNVRIERLSQQYWTNAAGIPELEIKGIIRNSGTMGVRSADLDCRFRTSAGEDTSLQIPLIIPVNLDDENGGPLKPLSSREFAVRIGNFPDNLEPAVLETEVTHTGFLAF